MLASCLAFSQGTAGGKLTPGFQDGLKLPDKSGKSLYPWETSYATVLPNGDLQWAPRAFQLVKGSSVKYIDFDNGNDNNDGLSTSTAWKHHPWDAAATGNAAGCTGIHTYIFRRGVIYRGVLNARDSGEPGNPVRLTSDPDWGSGEAAIHGSIRVEGGWTKADATIAPAIPNPGLVWYKDIGALDNLTKVVCEVDGSGYKRVYLARSPDYTNTPDEPMQTWWSFTKKEVSGGYLNLTDVNHLVQAQSDHYKNGDVWAIEDAVVMATLWRKKIQDFVPSTNTIKVALDGGVATFGGKDCKYYVENTPYMLSAPGEYYYDQAAGRMFIRLNGDRDPNTTAVEIAGKSVLISMASKHDIEISGLTVGFTTYDNVRYGYTDGMPAILMTNCSGITVRNCIFHYVNGGIMANGTGTGYLISDNDMSYMDDFSVMLNGPDEVSILRNRIFESGTRHLGRWYGCIPAIAADPLTIAEVAGNIIEHAWGSAINLRWGKTNPSDIMVPFIRGFVHHNKVTHSLQGVNDYGGIECWQGGPVFSYNNISQDAQGWHYNWWIGNVISLGYPFYYDGVFKNYLFNNIAVGTGWNRTSGAYMQVLGFYNMYVHNVAYNTAALTNSGDYDFAIDGQNYYLGNVSDSTQRQIDHTTMAAGVPFDSYGYNFFSGVPFEGCFVTNGTDTREKLSYDNFYNSLNTYKPDLGQVGSETSRRVFENPSAGDFRPTASSELIDKGVKFFVPFPLSRVVGEWNFCKHRSDSSLVKGENFYYTNEFFNRETYKNIAKNHMKAHNLAAGSYVNGYLEDFTEGSLVFNGSNTYCSVTNSVTSATTCNNVDMTTNNFILETFFKTVSGHTGGVLVSKFGSAGYGYQLDIDGSGYPRFSVINNGSPVYSKSGATVVNNTGWHHLLAEVDRQSSVVTIYIDGIVSSGSATGSMPGSGVSLTNTADFLAGKNKDGNYFSGTMDFLRVSKGTLADARTTIDELYKWEFDGPFLHDFAGNLPVGKRDAGALETGTKLCDMTLSSAELRFEKEGGTKSFTVTAPAGAFEIAGTEGSFYTYSLAGNEVTVTVPESNLSAKGYISVYGCNETVRVKIIQGNPVGIIDIIAGGIKIKPNPVTGGHLSIYIPEELPVKRARFFSITGEIKYETELTTGDNYMDINLPDGLYLLNISGTRVNYTTKIIICR
jgi:hypothetical protein